jgi:hypothetical protein
MPTKTIKFYFQVTSKTQDVPTNVHFTVDDQETQFFSFGHTGDFVAFHEHEESRVISVDVDAPYPPSKEEPPIRLPDSRLPSIHIKIKSENGDLLLVDAKENYTTEVDDDGSVCYTQEKFIPHGPYRDIISEPILNGITDTNWYDFDNHYALGHGNGDDGMGNLPIYDGQVVEFHFGYDFYRTLESE